MKKTPRRRRRKSTDPRPPERMLIMFGIRGDGHIVSYSGDRIRMHLAMLCSDDLDFYVADELIDEETDRKGVWIFEAVVADDVDCIGRFELFTGHFRDPTEAELIAALNGDNPWDETENEDADDE